MGIPPPLKNHLDVFITHGYSPLFHMLYLLVTASQSKIGKTLSKLTACHISIVVPTVDT